MRISGAAQMDSKKTTLQQTLTCMTPTTQRKLKIFADHAVIQGPKDFQYRSNLRKMKSI